MSNPSACIKNTQRGFTLVELMVTLSVVAILTVVAVPNLTSFVVGNRLSSDVNGFIGLINYARSEAIVRNQDVVICPKNDSAITCSSDQLWGKREIQVFVDVNGDGQRNASDELLKTIPATDTTGQVRRLSRSTATTYIKFGAVGMAQSAHRFDIYAVGDAAYELKYGRSVCISKPGRVRIIPNSSASCAAF